MIIHVVALLFTPILAALVLAPAVPAQKSEKVYRFGWVALFPPPEKLPPAFEALKARLAERGYIEGKNIMFEGRWANNDYQRVPELLADLERNGVDVIFPLGARIARITQERVKKTPIVFYSCDAFEHVARLARQLGNATGVTCMTAELSGKRLEILKEAVPAASRVVFFSEPEDSP